MVRGHSLGDRQSGESGREGESSERGGFGRLLWREGLQLPTGEKRPALGEAEDLQ